MTTASHPNNFSLVQPVRPLLSEILIPHPCGKACESLGLPFSASLNPSIATAPIHHLRAINLFKHNWLRDKYRIGNSLTGVLQNSCNLGDLHIQGVLYS
jgi:hypothetical protein